jgi:hypothetical protein
MLIVPLPSAEWSLGNPFDGAKTTSYLHRAHVIRLFRAADFIQRWQEGPCLLQPPEARGADDRPPGRRPGLVSVASSAGLQAFGTMPN